MSQLRLSFYSVVLGGIAYASPPPHLTEIQAWAKAAGYNLSQYKNCRGVEESHFGSAGSVCWKAKRKTPTEHDPRVFPRIDITLAVYRDDAEAKNRMARFHEVPKLLRGEAEKIYPLRAGFRVRDGRVLIVSTEALEFAEEVGHVAAALNEKLGGRELVCWRKCP